MARKILPSRKRAAQKSAEQRLRERIFEALVSQEAGGAKGYGADLIVNADLVYNWIKGRRQPYVVVDNLKS